MDGSSPFQLAKPTFMLPFQDLSSNMSSPKAQVAKEAASLGEFGASATLEVKAALGPAERSTETTSMAPGTIDAGNVELSPTVTKRPSVSTWLSVVLSSDDAEDNNMIDLTTLLASDGLELEYDLPVAQMGPGPGKMKQQSEQETMRSFTEDDDIDMPMPDVNSALNALERGILAGNSLVELTLHEGQQIKILLKDLQKRMREGSPLGKKNWTDSKRLKTRHDSVTTTRETRASRRLSSLFQKDETKKATTVKERSEKHIFTMSSSPALGPQFTRSQKIKQSEASEGRVLRTKRSEVEMLLASDGSRQSTRSRYKKVIPSSELEDESESSEEEVPPSPKLIQSQESLYADIRKNTLEHMVNGLPYFITIADFTRIPKLFPIHIHPLASPLRNLLILSKLLSLYWANLDRLLRIYRKC